MKVVQNKHSLTLLFLNMFSFLKMMLLNYWTGE